MPEIRTTATEMDRVLSALVELLASVNVAVLEDPSKYRVANTTALAALVARDVVLRHGLEDALTAAVHARIETDQRRGEGG
jgi:hypothetical protein